MTGALIAAGAGLAAGAGTAALSAHEQRKAANKQAKLQAEANREQERIAAGRPQIQENNNPITALDINKKSALQRTILTRSNSASKLGD